MTQRIKVAAQTHTTHVFYGRIPDERTGEEQATRTRIEKVTFQRYRVIRALIGTGIVDNALDVTPVTIPAEEYELFDTIQTGLPYSTEERPYTFLWRVAGRWEPLFEEPGTYFIVIRFHPREAGEVESLPFEVAVS